MTDLGSTATDGRRTAALHNGWTPKVASYVAILILVNVMVDSVVTAPTFVLPHLARAFDTTQFAWIGSSAMLAGAMWAPLLGKSADIHGKRRVLVITLLVAAAGGLVCLSAPHLTVFVLGRLLQGAAVAALFLSIAIIRDICAREFSMVVTGVVTAGSAVFGIVTPFVLEPAIDVFGWRSVFVISASFAAAAALLTRLVVPDTRQRTPGTVDVAGALVLGGGIAGVLGYISLGQVLGWAGPVPLLVLAAGAAALVYWRAVLSRKPEPIIDIRGISLTLGLGLLVVVMGTGAYQSKLQLISMLVETSPDEGLGYGLASPLALGLMFGVPSIGIALGGVGSGAIATRVGPAWCLAVAILTGTTGTALMYFGDGPSHLAVAVPASFLLSLTAGNLVTSGFNLASILAPRERQATVSGLVMVMVAIGSVTMNFVGSAILGETAVVVDGEKVNSVTGIYVYIATIGGVFVLAAIPALFLVRAMRGRTGAGTETSSVSHL
ncbi:MFS transporter [Actinomadura madurae]|uniref:MFS transporter n=1 Tax=Actinomadura madurae TaxID=1993 RepID=UPI0020269952|nr:MFS transporter [Actinomadura madurae]MCP9967881.1 MFS transporter [Actinomadura madurae]MCQ0016544.1 MFS transporter [Actinomadura madurae]URM96636.1 MFS transporter [Actinomadura madurae]URN07318.1 MFS transporter [Actinomadura madurae]